MRNPSSAVADGPRGEPGLLCMPYAGVVLLSGSHVCRRREWDHEFLLGPIIYLNAKRPAEDTRDPLTEIHSRHTITSRQSQKSIRGKITPQSCPFQQDPGRLVSYLPFTLLHLSLSLPNLVSPPGMPRLPYALCALALGHAAVAVPELSPRATVSLDAWLATETAVSLNGILANIGADGAYAQSANPGVIIASPSTSNPDCERRS